MDSNLRIRQATLDDAQALLSIYAPYVKNTAISFEYEIPSLNDFKNRIRCVLKKYPYLVAEADGEIIGFAYAQALIERPAYDWSAETTIYLRADKKRQGIGSGLYNTLEHILKDQGILNLYACIAFPETEDKFLTKDSAKFHEKMGYHLAGKFQNCGYKFNHWYDIIWMEKHIGDHIDKPPKVKNFGEVSTKITSFWNNNYSK